VRDLLQKVEDVRGACVDQAVQITALRGAAPHRGVEDASRAASGRAELAAAGDPAASSRNGADTPGDDAGSGDQPLAERPTVAPDLTTTPATPPSAAEACGGRRPRSPLDAPLEHALLIRPRSGHDFLGQPPRREPFRFVVTGHYGTEREVSGRTWWRSLWEAVDAARGATPAYARSFVDLRADVRWHRESSDAAVGADLVLLRFEVLPDRVVLVPRGQGGLTDEQRDQSAVVALAERRGLATLDEQVYLLPGDARDDRRVT
jgi:hypothetical protein